MMCWALPAAVSRASVSSRLTRFAASRLASASICFSSSSRASSAAQAGDTLQFTLAVGDHLLGAGGRGCGALLVCRDCLLSRAQILFDAVSGRQPIGQRPVVLSASPCSRPMIS